MFTNADLQLDFHDVSETAALVGVFVCLVSVCQYKGSILSMIKRTSSLVDLYCSTVKSCSTGFPTPSMLIVRITRD